MWSFNDPPNAYLKSTYGFSPDSLWWKKARLGVFRLGNGCMAAAVSDGGLLLTNQHCMRDELVAVSGAQEDVLMHGFWAYMPVEERRISGLYAEQVVAQREVTSLVEAVLIAADTSAQIRIVNRREAIRRLERELTDAFGHVNVRVEIRSMHHETRFFASYWKRYTDVRLVGVPEHSVAYFGGDADNFTYPRYALDVALLRIYEHDLPLKPAVFFRSASKIPDERDAAFTIGFPGKTWRGQTVTQLNFRRDYELPALIHLFRSRLNLLEQHVETLHEDQQTALYGLNNSLKAFEGTLLALHQTDWDTPKQLLEQRMIRFMAQDSTLQQDQRLFTELSAIKEQETDLTPLTFTFLGVSWEGLMASSFLRRALFGQMYQQFRNDPTKQAGLSRIRERLLALPDLPDGTDEALLRLELEDMRYYVGQGHPILKSINRLLQVSDYTDVASIAQLLRQHSILRTKSGFESILESDWSQNQDVGLQFGRLVWRAYQSMQQRLRELEEREYQLTTRLSEIRYRMPAENVPPETNGSLRIADGRWEAYAYNGTHAPYFTTMYGLYERHFAFNGHPDWTLPETWRVARPSLDLRTPLCYVTSTDLTMGFSGAPLLNRKLELVGIVFDGNMESLAGEFRFDPETHRTVSVSVHGLIEALRNVYQVPRLAEEVASGNFRKSAW